MSLHYLNSPADLRRVLSMDTVPRPGGGIYSEQTPLGASCKLMWPVIGIPLSSELPGPRL